MAIMQPAEVVALATAEMNSHITSSSPDAQGRVMVADPKHPADRSLDRPTPVTEIDRRTIQATAIMLAESGGGTHGDTLAFRPAAQNPRGGNDRGIWQINSKAHPDVSDQAAFDPVVATQIAYQLSNGFSSWGPWRGSKGLDPNGVAMKTAAAAYATRLGRAHDDTPVLSQLDANADGIPDALQKALGWADALGQFLSVLISAEFWKRVGLGAAGVALVLFAAREQLAPIAKAAARIA